MVSAAKVMTGLKLTSCREQLLKSGVHSGKENTEWGGKKAILKLLKVCKDRVRGRGAFLLVQWVRLQAPNAGGSGFIPGWGRRSYMQ